MPEIPKSPFLEQQEQADTEADATRVGARPASAKAPVKGYLTVIVGDQPGKMHQLSGASMIIGRGPECDIRLDSDGVSRRHARILNAGAQYMIEDLGSTNGTWIDDVAVKPGPLPAGARIRVGTEVVVRFDLMDDAEAALQHRLYESGIHDTLTGAHNRRHFDRTLAVEVSEAARLSIPVALILLQIHDMRGLVEYYTQAGGDEFLRAVARIAKELVRSEDMFARIGPDTFGIVARGMSHEEARSLADNLREAIGRLEVLWQSGGFSMCIQGVTAEASVTAIGQVQGKATGDALLAEGMARLRRAKESGGNVVIDS
jgi:diguanylate cyclase (GGDEF)-like protein